jgi:hypothetical protein
MRRLRVLAVLAALSVFGCKSEPAPTPPPTTVTLPTPPPTTAPPTTTLAPVATTLAAPPPSTVKAAVVKPKPTLPTAPPISAPPAIDPARMAALVSEGETAYSEGKLAEAATAFAAALAMDPSDERAKKGKARTATAQRGAQRTFVPDLSSSEGAEGRLKSMQGFDDVEESNVRRAVKVPGRAEIDTTASHVKPGDPVKVDIFIRNLSVKKKKNIKIANVRVSRIVNDKETLLKVDWKPVEVQPKQRLAVASVMAGNFDDDVSSWVLDVKLMADETNDIYENRLVWK